MPNEKLKQWYGDIQFTKASAWASRDHWRECLLLFCISCKPYYLDLIVANGVRGNGIPQDIIIEEFRLFLSSCRFLPRNARMLLDNRWNVMRQVAIGKSSEPMVEKALRNIVDNHEGIMPDSLISQVYYQLAFIQYINGQYKVALDDIELALTVCDDNYRAYNLLGLVQLERGKNVLALKAFFRSTEINNGYAHSHFNCGVAYERSNHFIKAANCYVACLLIEPEFYEAIFNLSNVLLELNCFEEAGEIAAYGSTICPLFEAELSSNLAISLLQMGHSADGLALLKYIAQHNSADYIKFNLAYNYCSRGRFEAAKNWLTQIDKKFATEEFSEQVTSLSKFISAERIMPTDFNPKNQRRTNLNQIEIQLFLDYIEVYALRKDSRIKNIIRQALKKPAKHPLHYASKSLKKDVDFARDIVKKTHYSNAKERKKLNSRSDRVKRQIPLEDLRIGYYRLPSYSGG